MLDYARDGKLFSQSSMSGARAFSDAIVEHLMKPINDNGASVALLNARHSR